MEPSGTKTREAALLILMEVNKEGRYANISLKETIRGGHYSPVDAAFITQLAYGTLEKQITLDWVIKKFATLKRVNPWIMNILRLGCYQILYLDRVPDSAACNEAVKLCKKRGLFSLAGFVNGILRNISRNKNDALNIDPRLSIGQRLSLKYSYPLKLVDKWVVDYGPDKAEDILRKDDEEGYTSIRVNTTKTTKEDLTQRLKDMNIKTQSGNHLPEALYLKDFGDVEHNPLYEQGFFTVQGESSMLVTHILDPKKEERILDACSSPGGKSTHIAERMNREGSILAWDVHTHRVELVKRNAERMDSEIIAPQQWDATEINQELIESFDRVLIDAPCSGWGIIHKKPDIKLRAFESKIEELLALQFKILTTCSNYVKPGGILIYSTCTINPEENEDMVKKFIKHDSRFMLEDFKDKLPVTLAQAYNGSGMLQLIPSRDKTDGFFITRLRRQQ